MTAPQAKPPAGTYLADTLCQNCNWVCSSLPIKVGIPVRQVACKNCGCIELRLASADELALAKKCGKLIE